MAKQRDTYKYQFKVGKKIVYRGVTSDPDRRAAEHRQRWPTGKMRTVGRRTTRERALDWVRDGGKDARNR
jgi:predicted GIY-YIG superfamily endonuclease